MAHRFWRSKAFTVWLQYLAAGTAMIPAGLIYVSLLNNLGEKRAFSLSLIIAIVVGLFVWAGIGHAYRMHFARPALVSNVEVKTSNEKSENLYAAMRFWELTVRRDELSSQSNVFRSEKAYPMAAAHSSVGLG